jgi:DNA helicase II / ATP-dependent DNA helicase PcrA
MDPVAVSTLNAPQREAVVHDGGPLVVFAGAGSGKTRVITYRVAHLLSERGVSPWNVLAVTFTNKAAGEMRARLERMIGGEAGRDVWVGTFHAVCARLLRRYCAEIGLRRDFTIYDDADQKAMVKRVLADLKLDDKRYPPKVVAGWINRQKQEVIAPDAMEVGDYWEEHVKKVYAAYEERMRAAGALDFGDLIYRMVVAIESDPKLRGELQKRFRHLLVDEFQDTNRAQYRLVRALAAEHRQITVVGDDDQSIYRWRGADRRNILGFKEEFPDARIIKLEQNYRSSQRILRAAHAIISKNLEREPKQLWTQNDEGAKVTVLGCMDEREEAELVVSAVRDLRASGRDLASIALFYRVHAQSRIFEEVLRKYDVPYKVVGGLRFYDRAEVKDLLAYLRLITNPEDDVSLLRVINVPPRGIGKKTIEGLLDRASQMGTGLWRAVEQAAQESNPTAKKLRDFVDLFARLRARKEEGETLPQLGFAVYTDTGYEAALKEQDNAESDARIGNVEELLVSMQELAENQPELDLAGFLELVTLKTDEEGADKGGDRLTLMTVHAAKGLEFPFVFVAGLEEGTFPIERESEGSEAIEELEEERRLAYVAFTRAEERLVLTFAAQRRMYGQVKPCVRSRFLNELPQDDVQLVGLSRAPAPRPMPIRTSRPEPTSRESYVDRTDGTDLSGIRVGMSVRHSKFGRGRVLRVKAATPPRVDVQFEEGVKTIQVTHLQPA